MIKGDFIPHTTIIWYFSSFNVIAVKPVTLGTDTKNYFVKKKDKKSVSYA